jgi:signal transduction histidine kinase
MTVPPFPPGNPPSLEQIAHLRHEMLTPINHILGLTEMQIDEAPETGLCDYVPALVEINTRGRKLLAIIEGELGAFTLASDLLQLNARLESEGRPALGQARKLAEQLHGMGHRAAAEEVNLVSSAIEQLLAISHETVQDFNAGESAELIRK